MIRPFGTLGTIFTAGSHAETAGAADAGTIESLKVRLDAAAQIRLGRSLAIRHINTGSCNGCELELRALNNIVYDLERFGLCFVDSPRHADVLLVTGPLTRNLQTSLTQAWDATPDPKWVVSVGDCAIDGGVFKGSYAVLGGAGLCVPVDLTVGGCPPSPARILTGLRTLLEANASRMQ
jgi:Ni,Fe-hydrogenase III small subunit